MLPPPGQQAPLASLAFRLDCSQPLPIASVDRNAKAYPSPPPFRFTLTRKGEQIVGCLIIDIDSFLSLLFRDLLFYEPDLGGKDNLPPSVIYIVHQQLVLLCGINLPSLPLPFFGSSFVILKAR